MSTTATPSSSHSRGNKGPGRAPIASSSRSSAGEADGLGLEELLEALHAVLAADTTLLVAAEGRLDAEPLAAVDPDRSGAQLAGDGDRTVERRAHDGSRQAVHRVVGDAHRVGIGVERQHDEDTAEAPVLGARGAAVDSG